MRLSEVRRKTVLIVTHGVDDHAPLVRTELADLGIEVCWFNTDSYPNINVVTFSVEANAPRAHFHVGQKEYLGSSIAAVLFSQLRRPFAPHIADPEARRLAESELRWTLEGVLFALKPRLWVNHPHANRRARSKLRQLRLAADLGFSIPDTLVTADPQMIRRQYQAWDGKMVAKLVGGQIVGTSTDSQYVIHTTLITDEDLKNDDALSACPAIYQNFLEKLCDIRVTVVGDEIFACRIDSQQREDAYVDWRAAGHAALDIQQCKLEASIADRCRALMRELGLQTAGIDLIVTTEGHTVFLEINAAAQWVWVQEATGLPIAASIARRLASACDGASVSARAP